jgi:hypothetical protein
MRCESISTSRSPSRLVATGRRIHLPRLRLHGLYVNLSAFLPRPRSKYVHMGDHAKQIAMIVSGECERRNDPNENNPLERSRIVSLDERIRHGATPDPA